MTCKHIDKRIRGPKLSCNDCGAILDDLSGKAVPGVDTEQEPAYRVDLYERQPDSGGNRHYDYITLEEHRAAEKLLDEDRLEKKWADLTSHEIVVLRSRAKELNLQPDVVDHIDRLALIRCLLATAENRDDWRKDKYKEYITRPEKLVQLETENAAYLKALQMILSLGSEAHAAGTAAAHSFALGKCIGIASRAVKESKVKP